MTAYVALVGKDERKVEIGEAGTPGMYEVVIGDRTFHVDAAVLEHGTVSLIVDDQSYGVELEPAGASGLNLLVKESIFSLEILDERRLRMRRATAGFAVEGKVSVLAPMPGKLVKVLVKAGEVVTEGQGLVVVEAMKMENELRSPKAGKVVEVRVKEGETVEGGAKLLTVE
jgi:biotin carboxyl carrier protein